MYLYRIFLLTLHTKKQISGVYITWVSQARKDLLADNFDIWKRHEEVGFIAKFDDSEENKKGSFDMTKVLPLSRWKKEEPPGDEDSDEEDSDYEEVLIPNKKQTKRKRVANETASSKRVKPDPKPRLRVAKKLLSRVMPIKQARRKRPRASMDPPPGAPSQKRYKLNQSQLKPLSIPSRR